MSVKIFARNSWAGNGADFTGTWDFFGSFCRKSPHAHKIPRFGGEDLGFLGGGGGSANFTFVGARIFLMGPPFCVEQFHCAFMYCTPSALCLSIAREPQ